MQKVSLKDIALRCNVSMQTVSKALSAESSSGTTRISAEKRHLIRSVAEEMGYRANKTAVMLRGGRSNTIGIIRPSWMISPSVVLLSSVVRNLNNAGFETFITNYAHNSSALLSKQIREFESRNVDGIILLQLGLEQIPEAPGGTPVLVTGAPGGHIGVDMAAGVASLAEHLIQCHGHRRFAMVLTVPGEEKIQGCREALAKHGLSLPDSSIICVQKNPDAMKQIHHALVKEKVTAFLCSNDYLAAKLSRYFQFHGVRVPEDAAVTGFDGMTFSGFTTPSITTSIQPNDAFGKAAAQMMVERIVSGTPFPEKTFLLKGKLRCGGSCGCPETPPTHLVWINAFQTIEEEEETVRFYDDTPFPDSLKEDISYEDFNSEKNNKRS